MSKTSQSFVGDQQTLSSNMETPGLLNPQNDFDIENKPAVHVFEEFLFSSGTLCNFCGLSFKSSNYNQTHLNQEFVKEFIKMSTFFFYQETQFIGFKCKKCSRNYHKECEKNLTDNCLGLLINKNGDHEWETSAQQLINTHQKPSIFS